MTTTTTLPTTGRSGAKSACRVVILHESDEALHRVNRLCDHLLNQHWEEVELFFDRWPFSALFQPESGVSALQAATEAQIVVISAAAEREFPQAFVAWAERWAAHRAGREGALVGVFEPSEGACPTGCERDILLHRLALRAGLDYLKHFPGSPPGLIPDAEDWCAARATTLTDTLSKILQSELRMHPE